MRQTTYNINDRRINWAEGTNITGNENVDKFHFEFDSEWDAFNAKFFVLIVEGTSYIDQLDNENSVILRDVVYDKENVEFGVYGIDTTNNAKLSTNIIGIETTESIWGKIRDISDLPSKTQWEIYTEEMLGLLAQGAITLEECQQALTDARSARDTAEGYKNTTKGYMDSTEGYKNTAKGYMDTTEGFKNDTALLKQQTQGIVDTFDANVSQKTTDFNDNASAKTTAFNNNATAKTTAFNENYTEKVGVIDQKASDFNNNYTNKTNAFNQNASDKTDAFNSNATSKTGTFNDNASSKTDAFNSNASSKTGDFNDNATSKTNTFNQNASDKTDAFNANYTQKVADFNDNTSTYVQRLGAVEDDVEDHEARITDLELLKSNLNVETTTKSTYHNIIDSLNAKIEDFVMYGMTEQYTTTGKNKLKIEDSILTDNGLTATISNGKIKITGTTTENYIWIKITDGLDMRAGTPNTSNKPNWFNKSLLTGNTYTFSKIGTCGYTLNGLINGTSTTSMLIASNATENTVDLTETILSGIAIYIQDSGTRVNIEFLIQAVEGNTADYNYEQYTGRTTFAFSNISTKY